MSDFHSILQVKDSMSDPEVLQDRVDSDRNPPSLDGSDTSDKSTMLDFKSEGNRTRQKTLFPLHEQLSMKEQTVCEFVVAAGPDGDLDQVKECVVNRGVDVKAQIGNKLQAIHLASYFGRLNVVQYLVETCHVDVKVKNKDGWTPLHLASQRGHLPMVQYLVEKCQVNVMMKDIDGFIALHLASGKGHLDVVQYFIQKCRVDVTTKSTAGFTAFHLACQSGYLDVVRYLVQDCHVDVTTKINDGSTALNLASSKGRLNVIRYIMEDCHLDVATKINKGITCCDNDHVGVSANNVDEHRQNMVSADQKRIEAEFIDAAGPGNDLEKLKECVKRGVDVESHISDGLRAIHLASYFGRLNVVQYLVETCRVDVNAQNKDGWTALHLASQKGHLPMVQYLVEKCQVNVMMKDIDGCSAFHLASGKGHLDIVKYFVTDCQIDVTMRSNSGCTAYDLSIRNDHLDVENFLEKERHSKVSSKSRDGYADLPLSSHKGYFNIVEYFRQDYNADDTGSNAWLSPSLSLNKDNLSHYDIVNEIIDVIGRDKVAVFDKGVDLKGKITTSLQALHLASYFGLLHIVKNLVNTCHVDVKAKAYDGWTALHLASQNGHLHIVRYLLEDCQVDVKTKNNDGYNSLHLASGGGYLNIVKYFLNNFQCDVTTKSNDGWTALFLASHSGHLDVVRYLIHLTKFERLLDSLAQIHFRKEFPTLVLLVPATTRRWIRFFTRRKFELSFVCQHSFEVVKTEPKIAVGRKWLIQAAPALYLSSFVERTALVVHGLPLKECWEIDRIEKILAKEIDNVAKENLDAFKAVYTNDFKLTDTQSKHLKILIRKSCDAIAEQAEQRGVCVPKQYMESVKNDKGRHQWVKKEYACKFSRAADMIV